MKVRTMTGRTSGARFVASATLATVLVAGGVALAAPSAAAACPAATKPPTVNSWYGPDGGVYGTTIIGFSTPNPGYLANNQQLTTYRTDRVDGSSRTETWRGIPGYQTRVSCEERPATRTRSGGGGERSGGGGGGLGAGAWSPSGGGTPVGTVTVRPIQHF